MKKMTKVISLALALVMCLALCACGKKEASYKMLDEKVSTEQYAIGFKKGNTELKDKINSALAGMTADDFNKIMNEATKIQPLSK